MCKSLGLLQHFTFQFVDVNKGTLCRCAEAVVFCNMSFFCLLTLTGKRHVDMQNPLVFHHLIFHFVIVNKETACGCAEAFGFSNILTRDPGCEILSFKNDNSIDGIFVSPCAVRAGRRWDM